MVAIIVWIKHFLPIPFTDEKCPLLGEQLCFSLLHHVCIIITSDLINTMPSYTMVSDFGCLTQSLLK